MGNSFPGLCSFKLEQSVECLNLENVVSFHFPYLTLISVLLLTEGSFRYQAEGRSEASPSAVTRHGAMQWTDKYGRLHYCLWCLLTRVCLSLNFVQFSHFVSGLGWLGWAVWAGLGWAGQHKSPYVIFTKVATSARLPTSVLPLTQEKISLLKDSSPSRQTHIHTSLHMFQENSDCSIVKCDYYEPDTAAPVSIFDPMLSSLPLSSISSLGTRAVNVPSQSCTLPGEGTYCSHLLVESTYCH